MIASMVLLNMPEKFLALYRTRAIFKTVQKKDMKLSYHELLLNHITKLLN